MIRIILLNLFLFALPFLLYSGYMYLVRGHRDPLMILENAPLSWLIGIGAALAVIALFTLGKLDSKPPGQIYVPSTVKDGQIVPGHFIGPSAQKAAVPQNHTAE